VLAQAQLPDRGAEEAIEFQEVSEDLQVGVETRRGHAVDMA
jgi:hypothetical protein